MRMGSGMKITKKKILMFTLVPSLVLSLIDLSTTYVGVCVLGGIELNLNAMIIAQQFGFIGAGVFYTILKGFSVCLLALFLWKARNDEISRIFMIVMIVLFLTDFANVVVLNINTLMYQIYGIGFAPPDQSSEGVTPYQAEQIQKTFSRRDFCRLIWYQKHLSAIIANVFLQGIERQAQLCRVLIAIKLFIYGW